MKQFNGTDYDTLYPKTIGAQITGAVPIASGGTNGTSAASGINNLISGLSQITPASNDLFPFRDVSGNTGGSVTLANLAVALGNNGVITPSNLATQASALGFTKIQTGSYVGTGTYGVDNPNSLTFDFVPKFVIVTPDLVNSGDSQGYIGIFIYGVAFAQFFYNGASTGADDMNLIVSGWGTNTLKWYNGDRLAGYRYQLNNTSAEGVKKYDYMGLS